MNNKSAFMLKHLSAVAFIAIYLILVMIHIVSDNFILSNQIGLIIAMLPFILLGIALDFILSRNRTMKTRVRILTQLLPLGVFVMQIVSTVFLYLGKASYDLFSYLLWLFIAAPFFIECYDKDGLRQRVIRAGVGTGAIIAAYLSLTTQTNALNSEYGSIVYYVSFFLMLYVASGIKKLPYLGMGLGIFNALFLLFLRYVPLTKDAKTYGWDYSITTSVELLIIVTFVLCILIRIIDVYKIKEAVKTSTEQ